MSLHLLNRGKRWCVPGAIALATDVDYTTVVEACYSAKRRLRGARIRGVGAMGLREMRCALRLLGWEADVIDIRGTMRSVLVRLPLDGRFILRYGGHVVVVRGHDVSDSNGLAPGVWSRSTWPRPRRRVTHAFEICARQDTPNVSTVGHT